MSQPPTQVFVSGGFDNIRSRDLRFLQEASRLGPLTVLLHSDADLQEATGAAPRFPLAERAYFLSAVRFVQRVVPLPAGAARELLPSAPGLPAAAARVWVDYETAASDERAARCRELGVAYAVIGAARVEGFPLLPPQRSSPPRKSVMVTGCYDWVHSGHVRFFEEVSAYGDLFVVVGHDANIRLLKGSGHPLFPQDERRYLVSCIRHVCQALVSTGDGWLDAEPEIQRLRPDIYAVNEDGDKGGKREYCLARGIEYLVLKRTPAPGLPARSSTSLRGF